YLVLYNLVGRVGARADPAHLAAQHVDHLRQFVQAGTPQEAPDLRHARVVDDLEQRIALEAVKVRHFGLHHVGAVHHRAELVDGEGPPVLADALLLEEHRARRVELDQHGDDRQQDEEERQRDDAQQDVTCALGEIRLRRQPVRAGADERDAVQVLDVHDVQPPLEDDGHQPATHPRLITHVHDVHDLAVVLPGQRDDDLVDLELGQHALKLAKLAEVLDAAQAVLLVRVVVKVARDPVAEAGAGEYRLHDGAACLPRADHQHLLDANALASPGGEDEVLNQPGQREGRDDEDTRDDEHTTGVDLRLHKEGDGEHRHDARRRAAADAVDLLKRTAAAMAIIQTVDAVHQQAENRQQRGERHVVRHKRRIKLGWNRVRHVQVVADDI